MDEKTIKERGLDASQAYLERFGLQVLDREWSYGKIDLVAMDGDTLVIVSVKTRKGHSVKEWTPGDSYKNKTSRIARQYISSVGLDEATPWRYDRIDILILAEDRALLRHHRSLFGSSL